MSPGKLVRGTIVEALLLRTAKELQKPTRELVARLPRGVRDAIRATESVVIRTREAVPAPVKFVGLPLLAVIPVGPVSAMAVAQVVNTLFFEHEEPDSAERTVALSEAI